MLRGVQVEMLSVVIGPFELEMKGDVLEIANMRSDGLKTMEVHRMETKLLAHPQDRSIY